MKRIEEIAKTLEIDDQHVRSYGPHMAKVHVTALKQERKRKDPPKLILVSAITPTPAGEGKTTTAIGLADAFSLLGERVALALREPSLGPCMGVKGGGTGGGRSRLEPSDEINLHFTGDFHAITAAHNLLSATIDNHLHFESSLDIESRRVLWKRVIDMNDRALRNVTIGLGGKPNGMPRQAGFDITAASELMAMLCLAEGQEDLRERIDRALVAFTRKGEPVLAKEIGVTGAMLALLKHALHPNLVQTAEGTPAFVHGGPFANIAHGCNSVLATRSALHHADYVVTEAGFGFDLGAEKFYDIKCRSAGLDTAAVVLVASVRALKMHGGRKISELSEPDPAAVERGLPNLEKHLDSIGHFGELPVVALNHFPTDTNEELAVVERYCRSKDLPVAVSRVYAEGGAGAKQLAELVREQSSAEPSPFLPLYSLEDSVVDKIQKVATKMYGARDLHFTKSAEKDLKDVERYGYGSLPVCIAKTQSSLSDDPKLAGRPTDFEVTISNIQINSGAGFLVVLTGDILRMPGLPRRPQAEKIDLKNGDIVGLK